MAAMVKPLSASREIKRLDFTGEEDLVMAAFIEGFCSFADSLNY